MPSKTQIANIALAKYREGRITSIESTTDTVAIVLNDQWKHALHFLLEEHRWNFAGKRATLSRLGTDPEFGYDYQYRLPADLIRLKEVNGEDIESSLRQFEIEGTSLLTDETTVEITYIYEVIDTNLFSPSFADALATKLAALTCARITGDDKLALQLSQQYEVALAKAILNDSKANGSRDKNLMRRMLESSGVLNVRTGGYYWGGTPSRSTATSTSDDDVEHGSDEW